MKIYEIRGSFQVAAFKFTCIDLLNLYSSKDIINQSINYLMYLYKTFLSTSLSVGSVVSLN